VSRSQRDGSLRSYAIFWDSFAKTWTHLGTCRIWISEGISKQKLLNKKSAATALNTELATVHTQTTKQWTSWSSQTATGDCEHTCQMFCLPNLGNACWVFAPIQGKERVCHLVGSECVLVGQLRLTVEWGTVEACPHTRHRQWSVMDTSFPRSYKPGFFLWVFVNHNYPKRNSVYFSTLWQFKTLSMFSENIDISKL
jgi:hypothetical protein